MRFCRQLIEGNTSLLLSYIDVIKRAFGDDDTIDAYVKELRYISVETYTGTMTIALLHYLFSVGGIIAMCAILLGIYISFGFNEYKLEEYNERHDPQDQHDRTMRLRREKSD